MLRLRDIMTRDVLTLRPDSTLRDAVELLNGNHIGGAPVVEHDQLVGVISGADIMDAVAAAERPEAHVRAWSAPDDDAMDAEIETASWFTTWDDDPAGFDIAAEHEDHLLDDLLVSDVMTRRVIELPPNTEVHAAAAHMLENGVHRILVVDDGRLEGLVSTTDFLRLIAERKV